MRRSTLIATLLPAVLILGVDSPPRAHHATGRQATNVRNVSRTRPTPVAPPEPRKGQIAYPGPGTIRRHSREIQISNRAAVKVFTIAEPAGSIQLFRVTTPHGTRVSLTASIPHLAGIAMSAPQSSMPSQACAQRGQTEVCTQSEEACPMPAAIWHVRLQKLAGPPGEIRVQLVIA